MSISVTVSASTKGRNFWLLLAPDLAATPHDLIDLDDGTVAGGRMAQRIRVGCGTAACGAKRVCQ